MLLAATAATTTAATVVVKRTEGVDAATATEIAAAAEEEPENQDDDQGLIVDTEEASASGKTGITHIRITSLIWVHLILCLSQKFGSMIPKDFCDMFKSLMPENRNRIRIAELPILKARKQREA